MTATQYRKKPVIIEAVQLEWTAWNEICAFAGVGPIAEGKPQGGWAIPGAAGSFSQCEQTTDHVLALAIPTLEGVMIGNEHDWIIKGVQGEFYPCKPDIRAATYEPVDGGAQ